MTEKVKNVKFSKKFFFMNFKDMIMWISLDENTSLRSVLNNLRNSLRTPPLRIDQFENKEIPPPLTE